MELRSLLLTFVVNLAEAFSHGVMIYIPKFPSIKSRRLTCNKLADWMAKNSNCGRRFREQVWQSKHSGRHKNGYSLYLPLSFPLHLNSRVNNKPQQIPLCSNHPEVRDHESNKSLEAKIGKTTDRPKRNNREILLLGESLTLDPGC